MKKICVCFKVLLNLINVKPWKKFTAVLKNPAEFWKFEFIFAYDLAPRRTPHVNNLRFLLLGTFHFLVIGWPALAFYGLIELTSETVMGNSFVLFYESMETSPRQFHLGEIGRAQKVASICPWEKSLVWPHRMSRCVRFEDILEKKRRSFQSEGKSFPGISLLDSFWCCFLGFVFIMH